MLPLLAILLRAAAHRGLARLLLVVLIVAEPCHGYAQRQTVTLSSSKCPARLYLVRGSTLAILADRASISDSSSLILRRGSTEVASCSATSGSPLEWSSSAEPLAFNRLTLIEHRITGEERTICRCTVELLDTAPFLITNPVDGSEHSALLDVDVKPKAGLRSAGARLSLDGTEVLPPDAKAPLTFDLQALRLGEHVLGGWVDTDSGGTFALQPVRFRVSSPVMLAGIGKDKLVSFKTADEARQTISAIISPALHPKALTFLVDGSAIGIRTSSPFETAVWDASKTESGKHSVVAELVTVEGKRFTSLSASIEIVNQMPVAKVDSPPVVISVKGGGTSNQPGPNNRDPIDSTPHISLASLRLQAARMAGAFPHRQGSVGTATGLSVLSLTRGGRIVLELGETFPIDATVRPGNGRTIVSANVAADARISAEQAAEYCKTVSSILGYSTDWSQVDIVIAYRDNQIQLQGNSAGAANAVATMSALLRLPVDGTVAITGAVTINGSVEDVGGVFYKAGAALRQQNIDTVVLPRRPEAVSELRVLFALEPDIFAGKRLILAANMQEVLRQSLIGYDPKFTQAEKLFQDALNLFGNEEGDLAALVKLKEARSLTPENATMEVWELLIRELTHR